MQSIPMNIVLCGLLGVYIYMCCIHACVHVLTSLCYLVAGSGSMELLQPCLYWATEFGSL